MTRSDEVAAQKLLIQRSRGGKIVWRKFLSSKILWIAAIAVIALVAWSFNEPGDISFNRAIWLLAGILAGRVLRDIVWMRTAQKAFPFMNKVIDWGKVEALAEGQSIDEIEPPKE